jgi:AraC family transcriptional regulator of adaptative response/methylated-DNA-[protein]-cysteine methyltransferase
LQLNSASNSARGADARIGYKIAATRFGLILVGVTARGVCWLGIHDSAEYLESELRSDYSSAAVQSGSLEAGSLAEQVILSLNGTAPRLDLPVDIRGTPFQFEVWRELCSIPRGVTRSYGEIARRLNRPAAARAVGHANGSNPVAIIIPCHRAIGAGGSLTGYRWGIEYKRRLLEHEGAIAPPRVAIRRQSDQA